MKKVIALVLVLGAVSFITACAKSAPSCADEKTVNRLIEMHWDEINKMFVPEKTEELKKKRVVNIINIRTRGHDKDTGRYECVADLYIDYGGGDIKTFPITYSSELLEDRHDFLLTVQWPD